MSDIFERFRVLGDGQSLLRSSSQAKEKMSGLQGQIEALDPDEVQSRITANLVQQYGFFDAMRMKTGG